MTALVANPDDTAAQAIVTSDPMWNSMLRTTCARHGLSPKQAIAMGDGANDLDMIRAAGLGVAYKAKPIVAGETHARIQHTDLRAALFFQGYGVEEIAD